MSETKAVAIAAGKGLVLWMLWYTIVIHSLIVLKWNATDQTIIPNIPNSDEVNDHYVTSVVDKLRMVIKDTTNRTNEVHANIENMKTMVQEFITVQNELATFHTTHIESSDDHTDVNLKKKHKPVIMKLRNLLQIDHLSTLRSSTQLNKYIDAAIDEISKQLAVVNHDNNQTLIDWSVYANFFHNEYKSYPSKSNQQQVCGDDDSTTTIHSTAMDDALHATMDDMLKASKLIQTMFLSELNYSGLPLSFHGTVQNLKVTVQDMIHTSFETLFHDDEETDDNDDDENDDDEEEDDDEDNTTTGNSVCLSNNDILPWINSGLDAMYRKKDVRQSIMNAMEKDFIDTSHIILDAELSSSDQDNSFTMKKQTKQMTLPTSINLRQMIDSELLHIIGTYLDGFIDLISGYNDHVDQFIDKYILAHIPDEDSIDPNIMGKIMIQKLLNFVGTHFYNVTLPTVKTY